MATLKEDELALWLRSVRRELERRTGRGDIEVTGGPYRGYDVRVLEAPDGQPVVDLYSPMRRDPGRVGKALDFAARLLEDWEATRAEHSREKEVVRPLFERLQALFPQVELSYTVGYTDMHRVMVARDAATGRMRASFDLWPAMREQDIGRLARHIRKLQERVEGKGLRVAGMDYQREE